MALDYHVSKLLDRLLGPEWHHLWVSDGTLGASVLRRVQEMSPTEQNQLAAQLEQTRAMIRQPVVPSTELVSLHYGVGLESLLEALIEGVLGLRTHLATKFGFPIPAVSFREQPQLCPNNFEVRIRDARVGQGDVIVEALLAVGPEENLKHLKGKKTVDPTYGMPGVWISPLQREEAERLGCMLFDPVRVICDSLFEHIGNGLGHCIGLDTVQSLLDQLEGTHPKVCEAALSRCGLEAITALYRSLVEEKVPIRDQERILTTMLLHPVDPLAEVRIALGAVIFEDYENGDSTVNYIGLESPNLENLDQNRLSQAIQDFQGKGLQPVVICPAVSRYRLRSLFSRTFPTQTFLAFEECPTTVRLNQVASVS